MSLIPHCLWLAALLGVGPRVNGARAVGASSSLAQRTQIVDWTGGRPQARTAGFGPASATDGLEETAWCEGAPGPGIGEWLEVGVDHPVDEVTIEGGFRKSLSRPSDCGEDCEGEDLEERRLATYKSNGRPALLVLTTVEGKVLERFQLEDVMSNQHTFRVRLQAGRYRLRMAQVYAGTRFQDTCIAEIRFQAVKEAKPVAEVLPALQPFAKRWSCRADAKTTDLPQEVRFDGARATRSARDIAKHRGAMNLQVAVRTPTGALLPELWVGCFWGGLIDGVECVDSGPSTMELETGALDHPAWSLRLTTRAVADRSAPWTADFASKRILGSGAAGDLQLSIGLEHGAGLGPVVVRATRAGAPAESARYTCTPLP